MDEDIVLKIDNVSKQYRLGLTGTGTISHDLNRWWHRVRGKEDPYASVGVENDRSVIGGDYVWAIQDVNIEVKQGEVIGIIGKNGAGKSTLLKLLSRITEPTSGKIFMRGRMAALLEVGTGFHPELTGKENIYLNGAILGMNKEEIKAKFEVIVEFSGCAKYVDTPVKRYSSGMRVRLGFAVAAFLEPDILVVDEVLAVGDAEFQRQAIGKMKEVSTGGGRTVLFVSHNMSSIRNLCQKVFVMDKGKVVFSGDVNEGIDYYLKVNNEDIGGEITNPISFELNEGKVAQLTKVSLTNTNGKNKLSFEYVEQIRLNISILIREIGRSYYTNFVVIDNVGNKIFFSSDVDRGENTLKKTGRYNYSIDFPSKVLKPGSYTMNIGINEDKVGRVDKYDSLISFEVVDTQTYASTKNLYRSAVIIAPELNWMLNE